MNPTTQNFLNAINPQGQGQPQQQLQFTPPQGQVPQAPQGQFQPPPPPPWQGQPQGVPQQQFQQPPAQQQQQAWQAPLQQQPAQAPQQPQQQPWQAPQQPMQGMPPQQQGFPQQPMQGFPQQPQQPMQGMPQQPQQGYQQQPMGGFPQQAPQQGYQQPPPQAFFFTGVGNVEITDNLPKLRGGFVGDVRIMRIEAKRTNTAGDRVFVEFDIVSSNSPQLHPPGQRTSWGVGIGDTEIKRNKAKQNLQKFTAACAGVYTSDTAQMDGLKPQMDQMINAALASPDQNAYVGRLVHVETNDITTKSGNAFVVHNWSPFIQHG